MLQLFGMAMNRTATTSKTVLISVDLHAALKKEAARKGMMLSVIVERVLRRHVGLPSAPAQEQD